MNLFHYRVDLVRVVDGDTVILDVDLGFNTWKRGERFRLARIDAPEMNTPEGRAARAWLVADLVPATAGGTVGEILTCQSIGQDKYGRWLAELFLDGRNLNDRLVAAGHAKYVH